MPWLALVPINADALFLSQDQLVAASRADFSRLPFSRNGYDQHPDVPFLSEEVLSRPLQNENLRLKAGLHLHWALPDALTKTWPGKEDHPFPMVPDRWLVTRFRAGAREKAWVVESNYLYPPGAGEWAGSISYPFPKQGPDDPPFRFMGRKMPWQAWKNKPKEGEYLASLTAVGYGDPSFAAFYPNCHSVFGFHDREVHADTLAGLTYEIVGWYDAAAEDFLQQAKQKAPAPGAFDLHKYLEQLSNWNIDVLIDKEEFLKANPSSGNQWDNWIDHKWLSLIDSRTARIVRETAWEKQPTAADLALMEAHLAPYLDLQTLYFCRLSVPDVLPADLEHPAFQSYDTKITVANTGTEALSAFLAQQLGGNFSPDQIEDQLEAIQLTSRLENRLLDIGAKFEEARHEKTFNAVSGGTRWVVRPQSDPHSASKADNVAEQTSAELPEAIGHALNQVNFLQSRYEQALQEIQSLKDLLFADWCKYLRCVYPPDGTQERYPDPDEVKYFIEQKDLLPYSEKVASTGRLSWEEDTERRVSLATATEGRPDCLAIGLANAINNLIDRLKAYNREGGLLLALKLGSKEADGTTGDSSGHEKQAQFSGGVTLTDDNTFQRVAQFNGIDGRLVLPKLENIKSVSFWAFLPEGNTGCLLDADHSPDYSFSPRGLGSGWQQLFVDGQQLAAKSWDALPRGAWVHIGLVAAQSFNAGLCFMSRASGQEFLAGKLANVHAFDQALNEEAVQRDRRQFARRQYVLQASAASRFWQAKEPVVLITGKVAEPSGRYGYDGRHRDDGKLQVVTWPGTSLSDLITGDFQPLPTRLNWLRGQYPDDHFAFGVWNRQPWNPLLLEWQVMMAPLRNKSNLQEGLRIYEPDFVTENYRMLENKVELNVKPGRFSIVNVAYEYSGSSVLTPYAGLQIQDKLEAYLEKQVLLPYYADKKTAEDEQVTDFTTLEVRNILQDYLQKNQGAADPVVSLIRAYHLLTNEGFHSLSQALGGFNEALLMRRLVMQAPVEDPLGFTEYQAFARQVAEVLGKDIRSAPEPTNDFNPIRSGVLRINQLRLVDSFGRSRELYDGSLLKSHHMVVPGRQDMIHLRPRLVQPARLNFRWLCALDDELEMNEDPDTSPICGWMLANHLDQSLMIYHADGAALCSLNPSDDPALIIRRPPGHFSQPFDFEEIDNYRHLQRMIAYLRDRQMADPQFLRHFLSVIDSALDNIDPENHAQHADANLLMSRPIALVRASLGLELQGMPAVNHDWNVFRNDLLRNTRQSESFTDVKFPIRLGEYQQLNDGLVGYWVEEGDQYKDNRFFAPQSEPVTDPYIVTRAETGSTLAQALSDAPQILSLLVDPRGLVHATTGILPAKAIGIPPNQYIDSLSRIEVTFLTTPLLSDSRQVQIPLPAEGELQWSWLANVGGAWDEIFTPGVVRKQAFQLAFPEEVDSIWDLLRQDDIRWIKSLDAERALVLATDERTARQLPAIWASKQATIEAVLSQAGLGQASTQAVLHGENLLREGWLKLKKV